jgi:hypothetical protein
MIQPLRRYHRYSFLALALLLPAIFAAGLAARRPLVHVKPAPDRVHFTLPSGTAVVTDPRELWGSAVDDPDPLLYWTADEPDLASLPANARLLGSLDSARRDSLRIPPSKKTRGYLILYSLAWQKPVARAAVPKEMP